MESKVILICGKICSGKSFYARKLAEKENAVILSTDEVTFDLTDNKQGEDYDNFAQKVNDYLLKKAAQIVRAGATVILDWGFWTKKERVRVSSYLDAWKVPIEWHYVHVSNDTWERQIAERNKRIEEGRGGSDFFVTGGLKEKALSLFEEPKAGEMDITVYQ